MDSESYVSPLLATLSITVVFAALALMIFADLPFADRVRDLVYAHTQKAQFVVATVATSSSLYYSEVAHFTPCELCWFQRIMMYPLAVLLGVAVFTRDRLGPRYIVTLAMLGLAIATYHYQLQTFPNQTAFCSAGVSCTAKYVNEFGFVSIPFMAGSGFLTILLLQIAEWRVDRLLSGTANAGDGE